MMRRGSLLVELQRLSFDTIMLSHQIVMRKYIHGLSNKMQRDLVNKKSCLMWLCIACVTDCVADYGQMEMVR